MMHSTRRTNGKNEALGLEIQFLSQGQTVEYYGSGAEQLLGN
jgi:hypothetical protein